MKISKETTEVFNVLFTVLLFGAITGFSITALIISIQHPELTQMQVVYTVLGIGY